MQNKYKHILFISALVFLSATLGLNNIQAGDQPDDMQGWEKDSAYNQLYDVREYEKIRAWVVRLKEVVPMPGMSPATVIEVKEGPEVYDVHLCPTWYRKPSEIRLKRGDRIKLKGAWAEVNGKEVFMASKVKQDPDTTIIKVRLTKDGTPFWTMPPEQLAMELKAP